VREITLYGRPECHLCEEARKEILALQGEGYRFELRELDIEANEDLLRTFLERIPVVAVDGEIVSELELDCDALLARLDTVRA
jgi:glutathione S-transferase